MRQFMALARQGLINTLTSYLPAQCTAAGVDTPNLITYAGYDLPWGPVAAQQLPAVVVRPVRSRLEPEVAAANVVDIGEAHDFLIDIGFLVSRSQAHPYQWAQDAQDTAEGYVQAVEEVLRLHRDLGITSDAQAFAFATQHAYEGVDFWRVAMPGEPVPHLAAVRLAVRVETRERYT